MIKTKKNIPVYAMAFLLVIACVAAVFSSVSYINWQSVLAITSSALISPSAAAKAAEKYINSVYLSEGDAPASPDDHEGTVGFNADMYTQDIAQQNDKAEQDSEAQQEQNQQPQIPSYDDMPSGMVPIVPAFYGHISGESYIDVGDGQIFNLTSLTKSEIETAANSTLPFNIELYSEEPQVLIMHTHTTETYELDDTAWTDPEFAARSTDYAVNMAAIGDVITQELIAAGITTLHDTTLHDYPSYTGSYDRSHATVSAYLSQYPSIKVVIDVHRDALQKEDGARIKPVAQIDRQTAAQVMLIVCADSGGNIPNYMQNLTFASHWQAQMEELYPGLTRPVLFDYRYYNQDLTTGSLLLEVGGHANTLQEALYAAELSAKALAGVLSGN